LPATVHSVSGERKDEPGDVRKEAEEEEPAAAVQHQAWRGDPRFEPVDGGTDRACRGADAQDEFRTYFTLFTQTDSLDICKEKCVQDPVCKGLEYSHRWRRCEIWTRAGGVRASVAHRHFLCLRLVSGPGAGGGGFVSVQAYSRFRLAAAFGGSPGAAGVSLGMVALGAGALLNAAGLAMRWWRRSLRLQLLSLDHLQAEPEGPQVVVGLLAARGGSPVVTPSSPGSRRVGEVALFRSDLEELGAGETD
jgi:hypothetical protein